MKDQSSAETAIDKAKAMIEGGWRIVPILPKQKRPAHTGWTEREFTSEDFRPDSGIGIVTGQGIVALDVDAYCEDVSAAIVTEAMRRFGATSAWRINSASRSRARRCWRAMALPALTAPGSSGQ